MITSRLTRAQWGAIAPERTPTRVSSMRGVAVHWVGGATWGTAGIGDHSKCAGKIRGIQRSHMAGEYFDVAYSEGVCPHGQRFELRGHNVQVGANGSSFANKNWYAILALVGKGDKITPELLEGISLAVDDYRRNANAGREITAHRVLLKTYTGRSTDCCGDVLFSHVTKGTFNAPATTTTAPPAPQEDDMPSAAEVADATATETLTRPVKDATGAERTVGWAIGAILRDGQRQNVQLAALTAAVESLATSNGADPETIVATVDRAVRDRLAQIRVTDEATQ